MSLNLNMIAEIINKKVMRFKAKKYWKFFKYQFNLKIKFEVYDIEKRSDQMVDFLEELMSEE